MGATSYDPIRASKLNTANALIYDRLVEQDADQSFHPHLATSWEEAADGMSWTFKLKEGVTFHDGSAFDAQTIADWIPDFAGTENAFLAEAIGSVEVIDPLTVKFVMNRPEPNLLYNLASTFMGVPGQAAYEAAGTDYGVTAGVGTGPFKLESFSIGLETKLSRNDDYAWASPLSENQGAAAFEELDVPRNRRSVDGVSRTEDRWCRRAARCADGLSRNPEVGRRRNDPRPYRAPASPTCQSTRPLHRSTTSRCGRQRPWRWTRPPFSTASITASAQWRRTS